MTEPRAALEHITLTDGDDIDLWTCADEDRVTVSAWSGSGNLVGLAWFDAHQSTHPRPLDVEVTPSHRRRGIGTALLGRLIAEASARHVATLTWTQPADDQSVRRLERASHAIAARRVADGRTKSTIFVPAA
jgi:GNAT superfamily N-acetyltransferase